jgi:hypothetical protein
MSSKHHEAGADVERLPADTAKKINGIGMALLVVGLLAAGAGFFADHKRFAFSYLAAFMWLLTIGLGGLFFVLIQHVVRAGWSVAPRRHAEWLSSILPASAILFLPIAAFAKELYEHWMGEHAHHDALIQAKHAYLNPTFFYVRAGIYFVIWTVLALWFGKQSSDQDADKSPVHTEKMQYWAPPSTFLFGFSLTFAAFDWLMSLDPHWYSTIFGVYIFAGGVVSALSVLALINIQLQKAGLLKSVSTVEHRHDIGKLLFGFTVFYAYIAFSQYFLIWYANIPEETIFYKHRWVGMWKEVSLLLLFGHFVGPFLVLLSRHAKRNSLVLGGVAVWMLFMHWIDMYWLVMPTLDHHGAHFTWIDGAALLATFGVGAFVLARRATSSHLFPIHDPRLPEARAVENL